MNRDPIAITLGIDPGPTQSGWAIYSPEMARVHDSGTWPNPELREMTWKSVEVMGYAVAIEKPEPWSPPRVAPGKQAPPPSRALLDTCEWVGAFDPLQAAGRWSPRQCRIHLCGSARARDPHVREALLDRLGPKGTKAEPGPTYGVSGHAWRALAVAVTDADHRALAVGADCRDCGWIRL